MSTDIDRRPEQAPAVRTSDEAGQVMALFQQALDKGTSPDALEKLVMLHDRVMRRQAELEFSRALVAFQSVCPTIPKSSTAKIASRSGQGYEFKFADYEQIMETIRPSLTAHGLSVSFDAASAGALLKCTCTLRHSNGHSATSSFELPTENASGATPQQKYGGALTYAKRMTLVAVLGLTLGDPDPEGEANPETITDEQVATLDAMLAEVNADRAKFLAYMNVASLAEIRAVRYAQAVRALEQKRKGKP